MTVTKEEVFEAFVKVCREIGWAVDQVEVAQLLEELARRYGVEFDSKKYLDELGGKDEA